MPKFYIKWKLDPTKLPVDPEEIMKLALSMGEMVKADMKAGIKDWGATVGGDCGYSISEGTSEKELYNRLLKYFPYVHFEVQPVLTIDQVIEAQKKVVAAAKK